MPGVKPRAEEVKFCSGSDCRRRSLKMRRRHTQIAPTPIVTARKDVITAELICLKVKLVGCWFVRTSRGRTLLNKAAVISLSNWRRNYPNV